MSFLLDYYKLCERCCLGEILYRRITFQRILVSPSIDRTRPVVVVAVVNNPPESQLSAKQRKCSAKEV